MAFQNRKRYGGMRDVFAYFMYRGNKFQVFQNRKRYGGMRDWEPVNCTVVTNAIRVSKP